MNIGQSPQVATALRARYPIFASLHSDNLPEASVGRFVLDPWTKDKRLRLVVKSRFSRPSIVLIAPRFGEDPFRNVLFADDAFLKQATAFDNAPMLYEEDLYRILGKIYQQTKGRLGPYRVFRTQYKPSPLVAKTGLHYVCRIAKDSRNLKNLGYLMDTYSVNKANG